MEAHKIFSIFGNATTYLLILTLAIFSATSARVLEEQPPGAEIVPLAPGPPLTSTATMANAGGDQQPMIFSMHDILGGSNPTAQAMTGIVNSPAVNGQLPFSKPNGAVLPFNNGAPQNNNNNIPFITGLSGTTPGLSQNNGGSFGNFPINSGQLKHLMFGTMFAFDDELTEGHELGSGLVGKAQGFYVVSSEDGTSQTMGFTAMFESGSYVDSLSFFGVHRTAVSESHLAVMGGTGKFVDAKGFAIVKTFPGSNPQTNGAETLLEFSVYVTLH